MLFNTYFLYVYNRFRSVIMIVLFFFLVYLFLSIAGKWLLFHKAGKKGWTSLIPFYNRYILFKMTWGNGWLFLIPFILGLFTNLNKIGWLFWVLTFVIDLMYCYKLSLSFGHGGGYAFGLLFFRPVFMLVLGLDSSYYHGVPQDGFTYNDIRSFFYRHNSSSMEYAAMDSQKYEDKTVMDAEFEEKKDDSQTK